MNNKNKILTRAGLKDLWNSFMVDGAVFSKENDIPFCPTILTSIPRRIITWEEAKTIYSKAIRKNKNFYIDGFVCFYTDDYKFDGLLTGVWWHPRRALKILKHFRGIITVDYSTYVDFPDPINRFNTYRMRAFGYWIGRQGLEVVNNVRWGYSYTYSYCFDGIEKNSFVAIGTLGCKHAKRGFLKGFDAMCERLSPQCIICFGTPFSEMEKEPIFTVDYVNSWRF